MLCDICKKNPATIHIQEINAGTGEKKVTNLCASCAAKQNAGESMNISFNFGDVIKNLQNMSKNIAKNANHHSFSVNGDLNKPPKLSCPGCHWTLDTIKSHGRLGCAQCYSTFAIEIDERIRNSQKGDRHVGKTPIGTPGHEDEQRAEIFRYQQELENAVASENYERAAELRDMIDHLTAKLADKTPKKSAKRRKNTGKDDAEKTDK